MAPLLWALLVVVPGTDPAEEPPGGAGVHPIEIVPRVELRQQTARLRGGATANDTTVETDVQFARRLLLRYQVPYRQLGAGGSQLQGVGDMQLLALGIVTTDPRRLTALIVGVVLDSASQPALGEGKRQLVVGAGAAWKPRAFWIAYGVAQQRLSVGGDPARAAVDELDLLAGSVLFGRQYNWLKLDLDARFDFAAGAQRLFGTLEAGSLLIGRVGLFVRAGTQLAGPRQLDYLLAGGMRYLFKLEEQRRRPP